MTASEDDECPRCGTVISGPRGETLCPASLISGALTASGDGPTPAAPRQSPLPAAPSECPREFGKYRLLGLLGRGGMGAYGLFIAIGPSEYIVAGHGIIVRFEPNTPGLALAGLATVEEGTFSDGRWVPVRRLAGDDTDQDVDVNLRFPQPQIQRVTLYRYE